MYTQRFDSVQSTVSIRMQLKHSLSNNLGILPICPTVYVVLALPYLANEPQHLWLQKVQDHPAVNSESVPCWLSELLLLSRKSVLAVLQSLTQALLLILEATVTHLGWNFLFFSVDQPCCFWISYHLQFLLHRILSQLSTVPRLCVDLLTPCSKPIPLLYYYCHRIPWEVVWYALREKMGFRMFLSIKLMYDVYVVKEFFEKILKFVSKEMKHAI